MSNGRRAEGEAENLVRRAVTAMAQIQVEQGLTSLSADPDDVRGNFRAAGAAETALDGETARVPDPPLPARAQAGRCHRPRPNNENQIVRTLSWREHLPAETCY